MKKLLVILLVLSMLLLSACSASDSFGNSSPSGSDNPDSSYTSSVSQTGTGDYLEDENSAEESSEDASDATSVSDRDSKDQEKKDPGTGKSRGKLPETGERIFPSRYATYVNAILMTCGMYDGSGDFAVRVGIPAKSGVGGKTLLRH